MATSGVSSEIVNDRVAKSWIQNSLNYMLTYEDIHSNVEFLTAYSLKIATDGDEFGLTLGVASPNCNTIKH